MHNDVSGTLKSSFTLQCATRSSLGEQLRSGHYSPSTGGYFFQDLYLKEYLVRYLVIVADCTFLLHFIVLSVMKGYYISILFRNMCITFFCVNDVSNTTSPYRLLVTNNRDELYQRPTESTQFWKQHNHCLGGKVIIQLFFHLI